MKTILKIEHTNFFLQPRGLKLRRNFGQASTHFLACSLKLQPCFLNLMGFSVISTSDWRCFHACLQISPNLYLRAYFVKQTILSDKKIVETHLCSNSFKLRPASAQSSPTGATYEMWWQKFKANYFWKGSMWKSCTKHNPLQASKWH